MLKGSCLCGEITYQYDGDITEIAMCHCQQCRKAQGTAFGTNAPINTQQFTLLSGQNQLKEYYSSKDKLRAFCQNCGSPLYSKRPDTPNTIRLRIGTLDTPITHKPDYHIYYDSRAEWFDSNDDLTKHEKLNP